MKKYIKFLVLIICNILFISTSFSSWVFNAEVKTDNSIAFENSGGIIENYNVNSTTEESTPYAKFTTLEDAVRSANAKVSGTSNKVNMYLTVGSFIDVKNQENLTFNSGVSLYLPYEEKKYDISSDEEVESLSGSFVDINANGIKNYLKSSLNLINTQIVISSGAKVFIGAKFGEKGVCGSYTQISLDQASNITVNGELHCNGYIKEDNYLHLDQENRENDDLYFNSFDSNRYVYVKSGGVFYAPITFYDAGGGLSGLTGLNDKGVFPINIFDFPTIQTYLRVYAGATFYAIARLSRSVKIGNKEQVFNVNKSLLVVKPSSITENSLLTLSGNSEQEYISFEYCPLTPGFTNSDASKTFIVINGTADVGYLTITVNGQDITTKDKFLPFSYKLQLIIGSRGHITTTYKIKFMGGSQLKILSGGVFVNNSEIIGYKSNSTEGIISYPSTHGDVKFIIDGTFEMSNSAKLGAHFSTRRIDNSAIINLTNVSQSQLNCTSVEGLAQTEIKIYSTGDFYDSNNNIVTSNLLKGGIAIHSDIQGHLCFESDGSLRSYVLSIIIAANDYEYPLVGYQVYQVDSSGNETFLSTADVYMNSEGTYLIETGYKFKVISLSRAEKTEFTDENNSSIPFENGKVYDIINNTEITITPGKGIPVKFSSDGESGNGGATYEISESLTENGTYYQIANFASTVEEKIKTVPIKENAYVQFKYTKGTGTSNLGDHYKFKGSVSVPSADKGGDEYRQNGVQLSTTIKSSTSTSKTQITEQSTIHAYLEPGGCFIEGSKVLMADGSTKNIEDLRIGDNVMVFNHATGQLDSTFISIDTHEKDSRINTRVMNLHFENGVSTKIAVEHGFFSVDQNKYVYINESNYNSYINEQFVVFDEHSQRVSTRLKSVTITEEYVRIFAPLSYKHLNLIVDNLLSISGCLTGIFNYFDLDENMMVDKVKMQADINKYGLYEYSDWSDYLTYDQFEAFNVKYLKVSVGKGLFTEQDIINYIKWYVK